MDILTYIITLSCASAFFILLAKKWGIVEWVQINGNNFFHEMFKCDFCLSFWMNLVLCLFFCILTKNALILLLPLVNTPITRRLL